VNIHPAIAFAFLLDLADSYLANLGRTFEVCAPARLQVDTFDLE
jgi:hypothetical protein